MKTRPALTESLLTVGFREDPNICSNILPFCCCCYFFLTTFHIPLVNTTFPAAIWKVQAELKGNVDCGQRFCTELTYIALLNPEC